MFFFKFHNRLVFVKFIAFQDHFSFDFCEYCDFFDKICVKMNRHSKCVECIRRDRFCVLIFLNILNCTHEQLKIQLKEIQFKLLRLIARIERLRKQMKFNKFQIVQKIQCVFVELDSDNNDTKNDKALSFFEFFDFNQFVKNLSIEF